MGENMSNKIEEQLSALMDGELPEVEFDLYLRRMMTDDDLRERWGRYQLSSAAMRRDLPSAVDLGLAQRIAMAVEQEARGQQSARHSSRRSSWNWQRPAAGFSVAASVAAIAVLGVKLSSEPGTTQVAEQAQSTLAPVALQESSFGTTVPTPVTASNDTEKTFNSSQVRGLLYLHAGQGPGSLLGDTRMVVHEGQR